VGGVPASLSRSGIRVGDRSVVFVSGGLDASLHPRSTSYPPTGPRGDVFTALGAEVSVPKHSDPREAGGCRFRLGVTSCGLCLNRLIPGLQPELGTGVQALQSLMIYTYSRDFGLGKRSVNEPVVHCFGICFLSPYR